MAHTRGHRGRTAYLCPRRGCLDRALKRRGMERSFGNLGRVSWQPETLWEGAREALTAELTLQRRSSASGRGNNELPRNETDRERAITVLLQGLSSQPARDLPSTRREP
jgi:hypothetical protein